METQLVKVLLTGDVAIAETPFLKAADTLMRTETEFESFLDQFTDYINFLTEHLPEWKHPRISAVLLHLQTPAVIESKGGLPTNFRRLFPVPSSWNDGKNKIVFKALQNALHQAEHKISNDGHRAPKRKGLTSK